MHMQPNQEKSEEFARLDWAILGLLINPSDQRPWSEAEIARDINTPGDIGDGLARLHKDGLVHRWDRLVSATQSAVRFYNLTQSGCAHNEDSRRMELSILEVLLTPGTRSKAPLSQTEIRRELGTQENERLDFIDALSRLDRAGLVDRSDELVFATEAAARFDYITSL
jgi:hypothetical protein